MTIRILPQEFHFVETGHDAIIKTCVAKELLDDPKMYMSHIRQMRLAVGTMLRVQVLNEAKNTLLHEASFRITAAVETQIGQDDDYGSRVRPQTNYQIERMTDWWSSSLAPVEGTPAIASSETEVKWNPGRKLFEVIVDGKVVGTDRDKNRALALASEPQPVAA